MNYAAISDPIFREAIEAIDAGDLIKLQQIFTDKPALVAERLPHPAEGYFQHPYLLWFVAGNPVRHEQLAANIVAVTRLLIETVKQHAAGSFQSQIDYTLGLVATGRVPRDCKVQIELMDLLLDAGAMPGTGLAALANGNIQAAEHLLERGGKLTLPVAVGLGRQNDAKQLITQAHNAELDLALVVAAFFGKTDMVQILIDAGANPHVYPNVETGFHPHATALHQAVWSASLQAVSMLVAAGADLTAKDKIYEGTPVEWAMHIQAETTDPGKKKDYAAIKDFLQSAR